MLNQNFQEPFVAIVIDPVRTISAGKVCLGAFRTYPKVKFIHFVNSMSNTECRDLIIYEVEVVSEKNINLIQTPILQVV